MGIMSSSYKEEMGMIHINSFVFLARRRYDRSGVGVPCRGVPISC